MNVPIKIAIADDHDIFKQGIEMVMKFFPDMNLMIQASNGEELLEQIKDNQPDVILLDLRMPVMNGLSTLQELKRLYHMIKIIILSMDSTSPDIQKALKMGADGYLLKTADPEIICKTIRDSCNSVPFIEPVIIAGI